MPPAGPLTHAAPGFSDPEGPAEVTLERRGPSYIVKVAPIGATFLFREVRTDRELTADVTVMIRRRHLFRSTVTLSLTGRDRVAKTAAELCAGDPKAWRLATFAAIEAVMDAEERLGSPVDLRSATLELPAGGLHVLRPFWPLGSVFIVAPGDAGKSTIARACAISVAAAMSVIPGIEPADAPRPVLYVAGEDPVVYWHARSIEAICRGLGIDRASIAQPIELFDARGRPLYRIARAIAERAADFGAVVLDSHQSLLSSADAQGGIRDRDGLFWNAVDQTERPTAILGHPNRADARSWTRTDDGRIAGSEVNRDRVRMAWRGTWRDEPAVSGTSYRRYTFTNTKGNHGPKAASLAFAAAWQFGIGDDPGTLTFHGTEPLKTASADLSPQLADALAAYRDGATTPAPLAQRLGIGINTAKSRLRLLRDQDLLDGSDDDA